MRVAEDGKPYTYEEFIDFFGTEKGQQLWRDAPDHIEARAWGEQPNTCEKHCEIGQLVQVTNLLVESSHLHHQLSHGWVLLQRTRLQGPAH
jgi:hypothetical protein